MRPRSGALLLLASAVVVLTWTLATPITWTIFDEQAYLTQAQRFASGEAFPAAHRLGDVALPGPRMFVDDIGREVPEFGLGWPLLLAPLARSGPVFAFGLTLLLHLLGTAAFVGVLRRLGMRPLWALLYLLHPTAILLSRSAMADVPTMAATAIGLYAWLEPRRPRRGALLAGLIWGASLHLRLSQGPLLVALSLAALWTDRERGERRAPALLAGLLPGVVTALLLSVWLHGTLLPPTTASLSPVFVVSNLPVYALWLLLLYPGLLLVPLRPGPLRAEAIAMLAASLALFGVFEHRYTGLGAGALVVGLRFFLPATVLLLPGYARRLEALSGLLPPRVARSGAVLAALTLLSATVGLQVKHGALQRSQDGLAAAVARRLTDDVLISTNDARELLMAPGLVVVPEFRRAAVGDALTDLPAIQLLTSTRADRPNGGTDADALLAFAEEHWTLTELMHVPADGPTPAVTLWRGRRRVRETP